MAARRRRTTDGLATTLVGGSAAMRDVRRLIAQVAPADCSCLVTGPSGSGKEVVARALHDLSSRNGAAFETVNCGAIPLDLIESEMFGHQKGAFTGAIASRAGRFERADGGTLFLDEIGDMPFDMQVKLLRVLETRRFERVGGGTSQSADVRIVAATHARLERAIADGRFREDLFYRLNVMPILLPALADRREDVEELIAHFATMSGHTRFRMDAGAIAYLSSYDWPGNVRELRNFCERAAVLHAHSTLTAGEAQFLLSLGRAHAAIDGASAVMPPAPAELPASRPENVVPLVLPALPAEAAPADASHAQNAPDFANGRTVDLREILAAQERNYIEAALSHADHVVADAARLLGLQRTTLCEKMRRYEIAREVPFDGRSATA
ncbi:MAG: sigma-54 dependent transcriptional regulator [Pseudomonadota bacterium]